MDALPLTLRAGAPEGEEGKKGEEGFIGRRSYRVEKKIDLIAAAA